MRASSRQHPPRKVILAPDSFKGALTARQATDAMAAGFADWDGEAEIVAMPIADGGEGTLAALASALPGSKWLSAPVTGPLGEMVAAQILLLAPDFTTAALEMASASGLLLVDAAQRSPMRATSYGTGELMRSALAQSGIGGVIVGLGGSATCDCGAGCLQALGFDLLDGRGKALTHPALPADLKHVATLSDTDLPEYVRRAKVTLACDVDNPLTGARGAARVFAPQKGATPEVVDELDALLAQFGSVLGDYCRKHRNGPAVIAEAPGAGAAGGLGAALMAAFPSCECRRGIDLILDYSMFDEALSDADLVITGEGCVDATTLAGKAVTGVIRRAEAAGVSVALIAGSIDAAVAAQLGVAHAAALCDLAGSTKASMEDAAVYLRMATAATLRDIMSVQHPSPSSLAHYRPERRV